MTRWEQLIAARDEKHVSQSEAAELLNVGLVTYQRWEGGKAKPQPQHLRRIHEIFRLGQGDESVPTEPSRTPSVENKLSQKHLPSVAEEDFDELPNLIAAKITTHLLSLAFIEHATSTEKRNAIQRVIKDFDAMNTTNKNYQINRREALCALATLPMLTFGLSTPEKGIVPAQYGSIIAQCNASLEACWELYWSNDANDTRLAFKSASKYLSLLQEIVKDSANYRQEALDLATRYALLQTLLGWICVGPAETIQYAKNAVALSKETGDISLQLSAYSKLAWGYFYSKKYSSACKVAQEAETLLLHYSQNTNTPPLHAVVKAGTYSTLALMQATNRQSPDTAIQKVSETIPVDESYALMTSKRSSLLLEAGWSYCYSGNQKQVQTTLAQRIDLETLTPKIRQSEMGRVETINVLALSSLKTQKRDMEQTIHFWVAGMQGAKSLQNEQRFNEAVSTYELMEVIWPDEQRVKELRDYIVHWN